MSNGLRPTIFVIHRDTFVVEKIYRDELETKHRQGWRAISRETARDIRSGVLVPATVIDKRDYSGEVFGPTRRVRYLGHHLKENVYVNP